MMSSFLKIISLNTNHGLPSDQVHAISQDLTNRIWFAGPTGLSMYNGNKIRVFDKQSGIKCQGLRTIEILDDIVWLGTDLGLESINTDGSPTNFILEKEWTYGLAQKIIGCENTIWVGTSTGLLKIDINGNRLIVSMNAELGFVKNIILLDNNTVIATSAEGLIKCDGETIIHLDKDNFFKDFSLFCLKKVSKNRLLVGTNNGLFVIDHSGTILEHINPNEQELNVTAISVSDSEWWIGAGNNLFLYQETLEGIKLIESTTFNSQINDIFIDTVDNIWVALNSEGVKKISFFRKFFSKINFNIGSAVFSIKESNNNSLYIGGETFFSTIPNTESVQSIKHKVLPKLSKMIIWDSCQDPKDSSAIWLAAQQGLFFMKGGEINQIGGDDKILKSPARCVLARGDDIYVGTIKGLTLIRDGNYEEIKGSDNSNLGYVYSISIDINEHLWVATLGRGLWQETKNGFVQLKSNLLSPEANTYTAVPHQSGRVLILQEERVIVLEKNGKERLILEEYPIAGWSAAWLDDNRVIIGSNNGLLVINIISNSLIARVNLLLDKSGWQFTTSRSLFVESEERIYCGLNAGLYILNLKQLLSSITPPEIKAETTIWENTTPVQKGNTFQLKIGKWSLKTPVFSAWFIAEENIKYRFKLIGFDKNWSELQQISEIKYNSLLPGKYELQGQVYTPFCGFGDPTTLLRFNVLSDWWVHGLSKIGMSLPSFIRNYLAASLQNRQLIERNIELENEIKNRELAEKNLKVNEKKYRSFFETARDGAFVISIDGDILDCNDGLIRLFGFKSKKELLNINARNVYGNNVDESAIIQKIVDKGFVTNMPVTFRKQDGTLFETLMSCAVIRKENDKMVVHGTITDITERKKAEEKANKLAKAVEQSPESILITDKEGYIEYVNPIFTSITGYSLQEVMGEKPGFMKSGKHSTKFYQRMWNVISNGDIWQGEFLNKKKNGELFWERVSISPIKNESDRITNYVGIKEDITEKKKILADLELAKEKAEESDRLKSAFLASMSHEIRTPLNAIVGFSNIIAEESEDLKFKDLSDTIYNQNDLLLQLVNDLLDFSKVEAGILYIENKTFSMNELINKLFLMFKSKCPANVELIVKKSIDSIYISSDELRINQILSNLISNAIKFTHKGNITFGYEIIDKSEIKCFVSDTGIGIPLDKQNQIFERFNKLDKFTQGTGLGLAIVKNIVELMNGEIWLESEPEKGSCFYFKLPSLIENQEKPETKNTKIINKIVINKSEICILIAEDNESNFSLLETLLGSYNINILHVKNGKDAVDLCKINSDIDLVLMDIKMPILDGYDATMQIKQIKPNLPIIAQTAHALPEDKSKAKDSGCDDYISKPIIKEQLISLLNKYIPQIKI